MTRGGFLANSEELLTAGRLPGEVQAVDLDESLGVLDFFLVGRPLFFEHPRQIAEEGSYGHQ